MIDPFEDAEIAQNLEREALIDRLESLELHQFSDAQLDRISAAVENLLVTVDEEYFRRDSPPDDGIY